MNIYICNQHGVGEVLVGSGSAQQIRDSGCIVCKYETLRARVENVREKMGDGGSDSWWYTDLLDEVLK